MFSIVLAVDLNAQFLQGYLLWFVSRVSHHSCPDVVFDSLGDVVNAHEIFKEKIQARELVNESEIIKSDRIYALLAIRDVSPYTRAVLLHIDDQVLKLLLVQLEMFHHHIVAQPISLVEKLNVVEQVHAVLFC